MSKSLLSRCLGGAALPAVLVMTAAAARAQDAADATTETVTVLGQALYVAPSAAPTDVTQPTSVVQEGFIKDNIVPQSSYDDIVKFEPSVWDQSPNGPGLGKSETLSLRGFQDGQFNVTFDGIPFGDATDLHHTSSALFIAHDIGQAEVDRGPGGGATIGKATFGGTMGFRTKAIDDSFSINPYATYGSFNTWAGGLELNTGDTPVGSGYIDLQHEGTDGYLTYAGEHRNNVMGKWKYDIDDTTEITLLGSFNHEFQYTTQGATLANIEKYGRDFALNNDPSTQAYYGYNPSNYYSDFYYVDVRKTFGSRLVLENKAYTDYFAHVYQESADATDTDPKDSTVTVYPAPANIFDYVSKSLKSTGKVPDMPGKAANARFRAWGDIFTGDYDTGFGDLKFGNWFDGQHDRRWSASIDLTTGQLTPTKHGTPYSYYYHTLNQTFQPYVEFDWKVTDDLTVEPGVKYTDFHRHAYGPINKSGNGPFDESDNYDKLQPSIAAHYTIRDGWTAYAQVASGFLAPPVDVFQVSSVPAATAGSGTTHLHGLKPEDTWNYQIGSTLQQDDFTVSLDAYYIDFSNFFASVPLSSDPTLSTYVNAGGAIFDGIEAEGQYAIGEGWSLYGNYSLNSAWYRGTTVGVAESPAYTAAAGLLYDMHHGFYGSLIGKLVGPRWGLDGSDAVGANDQITPSNSYRFGSVVTFDLALGYRFGAIDENVSDLTAGLKIANLLDNRQITDYGGDSTNGDPIFWTVAGRSIFFNISASVE